MQYAYPAVLHPDEGQFHVIFPDIEGCITCGDTLPHALLMAQDALSVMLIGMEDASTPVPQPTPMESIPRRLGDVVTLVAADTEVYRKYFLA